MIGAAIPIGTALEGLRAFTRRPRSILGHDMLGPAVIVALVCLVAVAAKLHSYQGNPTGFVGFGGRSTALLQPPKGAYLYHGTIGYDGQFYYVLATHLDINRDARLAFVYGGPYRAERIAYPALAAAVALGDSKAIPWALLGVNLVAAIALTLITSRWLRHNGSSGWWSLAVGLAPGTLMCLLRDLTDLVGLAALVAGIAWWSMGRWRIAAAALVVAVLSREASLLVLVGIGYDVLRRRQAGARPPGAAWVLGVPLLAFAAWQTYATIRLGGTLPLTASPPRQWGLPGFGIIDNLGRLGDESLAHAVWDFSYIILTIAAVIAALLLLTRSRHWLVLLTAGQGGFTLIYGAYVWDDRWNFVRLSLPLFTLLLVVGLQNRARTAVLIPCAAAAIAFGLPIAVNG